MGLQIEYAENAIKRLKSKDYPPEEIIHLFIKTYGDVHRFTIEVLKRTNSKRLEYLQSLILQLNHLHGELVRILDNEWKESPHASNVIFVNTLRKVEFFEEIVAFQSKANSPDNIISPIEKLRDCETVTNSIKSLIKGWIRKRWMGSLLEIIDEIISLLRPL